MLFVFGTSFLAVCFAQDEPAIKEAPKQKFTRATFNSTRIINFQNTEIVSKGALQFMISHHFSNIWTEGEGSQNLAQLFGLNSGIARTYLSFDYSPTNWMNLGLAAAGSKKYEGWAKFKILRQQTGLKNIPVSVTYYTMCHVNTTKDPSINLTWNKFSFMNQLLIARKFSDKFSLQFSPAWIHFNIVPYGANTSNEVFSLGLGGKYKVSDKLNLTFEYARQLNMYENLVSKSGSVFNYHPDLIAGGIEINTGGHLFQFFIGNTTEGSNIDHLARNNNRLKDLALGFTLNRSLSLTK